MKTKHDQIVALWPNGTISVVHGVLNNDKKQYEGKTDSLFWCLDAEGDPSGALLIAPNQHVAISPGKPTIVADTSESGQPIKFILFEGIGGVWREATPDEAAAFFSKNSDVWTLEDCTTWEDEDE